MITHEAKIGDQKILIVTWAVKDNKKMPPINQNDRLEVSLTPFQKMVEDEPELSTYMMIDQTDNYSSQLFWVDNLSGDGER